MIFKYFNDYKSSFDILKLKSVRKHFLRENMSIWICMLLLLAILALEILMGCVFLSLGLVVFIIIYIVCSVDTFALQLAIIDRELLNGELCCLESFAHYKRDELAFLTMNVDESTLENPAEHWNWYDYTNGRIFNDYKNGCILILPPRKGTYVVSIGDMSVIDYWNGKRWIFGGTKSVDRFRYLSEYEFEEMKKKKCWKYRKAADLEK